MKHYLISLLSLIFIFLGLVSPSNAAQTQTFKGQPIELKSAGTHYHVLGYDILSDPQPRFAYDDDQEVERYLVVHMQVSRGAQQEYADFVDTYLFKLWNGPNSVYVSNAKINTKKYPQISNNLATLAAKDSAKIKPGKTRNFDVLFVVDPNNSLKLMFDNDTSKQYVWLQQIKSSNGITAD
ncbi:hypothetical protein [Loigolactobacillus zhaoyuanensis]|uniref:DUF5067 domain-containing protein n=1 Tax=Loigolactobacillus zhaoyuanensis TaxID=2486017 RepID=A0ABW8U9Q1_9LACO|nr:hypothetical protein [Loigolactobacillus zhaoyuanensis]